MIQKYYDYNPFLMNNNRLYSIIKDYVDKKTLGLYPFLMDYNRFSL